LFGYFKESSAKVALPTGQAWKPAIYSPTIEAYGGGLLSAGSFYTRNYLPLTMTLDVAQGNTDLGLTSNVTRNIRAVTDAPALGFTAGTSPDFNIPGSAAVWSGSIGTSSSGSSVLWGMGEFSATSSGRIWHLYYGNGSVLQAGTDYYKAASTANPFYNKPITIKVVADKYLNVYDVKELLEGKLDYTLKLASATERGGIKGASSDKITLKFTGVDTYWMTNKDVIAYNYLGEANGKYKIFPEWVQLPGTPAWGPAFNYTYIKEVTFTRPAGITHYQVVGPGGVANPSGVPTLPTGDSDGKVTAESMIGIYVSNLTTQVESKITVTVTDVFGFKKAFEVPLVLQP